MGRERGGGGYKQDLLWQETTLGTWGTLGCISTTTCFDSGGLDWSGLGRRAVHSFGRTRSILVGAWLREVHHRNQPDRTRNIWSLSRKEAS